MTAFFCVSYLISLVELTLVSSGIVFSAGVLGAFLFFKYSSINTKSTYSPKKMNLSTGLFRVIFVVVLVMLFTGMANLIGPRWAGVMASFPIALCPLLIILTYLYKDNLYPIVINNFSYSITTLGIYYLIIFGLFPIVGVYLGTLISYLVCLIYVFFLRKILKY